ncbi:peptidoglycan binding domain-containing protein [Desulfosporosinus sp. BG]|uniref:peptidoglycan binding domain-containing protein n=1 Tax=Desulfosporosinus sp. BG TaxID=1633135 RepID=UPI00085574D7|nr:Vancomycin B-type resistance protein VanW [Desulfosporosinus sp. BG]
MEEDASLAVNSSNPNLLKRYKARMITLGVVIILLGVLTVAFAIYTKDSGEIANGIVLEIPLGKLNIEDAQSKLEQKRKEILDSLVHFTATGTNISINMKELGLNYNYDTALQQAYLIGRKGSIFEKAISRFKASRGITLNPEYQWNDQLLAEALNKYLLTLNTPAEDARFKIKPDNTLEIISEKSGRSVDIASLSASVKKFTLNQIEPEPIPIPFNEISPTITKKELESLNMTTLLSNYATHFNPNQTGRTENIKLAAKAIDGTVLKPKQEFSFTRSLDREPPRQGIRWL